jgi:hypothetical protein
MKGSLGQGKKLMDDDQGRHQAKQVNQELDNRLLYTVKLRASTFGYKNNLDLFSKVVGTDQIDGMELAS